MHVRYALRPYRHVRVVRPLMLVLLPDPELVYRERKAGLIPASIAALYCASLGRKPRVGLSETDQQITVARFERVVG